MVTEEQIKNAIKENLIKYRKANGLTGENVSEALNMNHGTYRSWETGRSSPKFSYLIRLAKIYGISIDELIYDHKELRNNTLTVRSSNNYSDEVYGDDYLSQLSTYEKLVVMKVRQFNQEDKEKLTEFIKSIEK